MNRLLLCVFTLLISAPAWAASVSSSGSGQLLNVTTFPASPYVGQIVVVTDDSVVGACDSGAGVAVTLCRWSGAAWLKVGDGTAAGGALSSADIDTSAEIAAIVTNETGTGALVFATSPTLVTPILGTPTSGTLTNATGLPIATGVSGLGAGVATALATPTSANVLAAVSDETGTGALVFATSPSLVTPDLGTPSAAVLTNATGTAAGLTAGAGDSATAFFSSGTIEDARLPTSMADKAITGSLNIPNGAAPTTDAFGEIAADNNAWAASRGAVQFFDGTANTYLLGTLATDAPANGECPKWNTGGTITWETCASGGAVATDTIWDAAGDLVYGTGSNTAVRLAPGTANQLLRMNAGATAPEWTSTLTGLTSVDFGSNPADGGRLRLSNNEEICWELNALGVDKCLKLNASDEFELNAPLNLTGTAGPLLLTGVASPSAPATLEQWYLYADSVDDLPKYIYNGGTEQTFYTTANPQTTITGNAATATALAANPADCSANQFATTIAASGALTCAAIVDADIPDTITASNYLPLAGGTMTGSLVTDNLGIEFEDSDTNPTCGAGEYKIFADLSETKFKKCMNTVVTDLDTTGGTPDFGTLTGGTNTTAAMVVGTGGSLAATGSGTIAATTAAALAANGGNCSAGSYPLGVGADGAVESCTAVAGSDIGAATATTASANDNDTSVATTAYVQTELTAYAADTKTLTNTTLNAASTGNDVTIKREYWWEMAGCNNVTAGPVFNLPTSAAATPACDTDTNIFSAWLAFADAANESTHGSFQLPTGFTGGIDWNFRYKMSSGTSSTIGWCVQLVRLPINSAANPALPALSTSNCVSSTTAATLGHEIIATISGATCTSCAAGDRVFFRISRDGNGTAVTDATTGVGQLTLSGPAYAVVY